ncbi:MAG: hypothetical protein M3Z04_02615 [Chloroflexota bacterium]|nr:hypothetical protein [Chloroflexota bacterium]
MAKREVNWQADIYDMTAERAADPSPVTPHPSGRISNLTARWRKRSPAPAVVSDPLDDEDTDTSLLLAVEDDPLLDGDEDDFDDRDDAESLPATLRPAGAARKHRPSRGVAARTVPADDNSGLLGLLLGALVGAGLTLLVTPAGGKQLRAHLQREVQHQADHGNADTEIVARNMPNTAVSEQAAPVAGAARP